MTERYPLAWPANRPRTPAARRRDGKFSANGRPISMLGAVERLEAEITRLRGRYPVLSSNVELRLDGRPRAGQSGIIDPGACVYFDLNSKPFALACDTYTKVEQNIAALAAHLDATRAIERYGVASAAESLAAFSALPPPGPRAWRAVLGDLKAAADVSATFRRLSAERHPDRPGGSHDAMAELTAARDAALKELGA